MILKVKRSEEAKEFPMLAIKKYGDVGLDLATVLPLVNGWERRYEIYHEACTRNKEKPNALFVNELLHGFVTVGPCNRYLVPTGIKIEIPEGYWASIEARSSTSQQMLIVPKGVIDEGYRGELFAQVLNVGTEPVRIYHGDRLVQLILHKREIANFTIEEVDELSESERGETGFGSTGK